MSDAPKSTTRIDDENRKVATVPRPKPALISGNAGHAIVPQSVEACYRMAELVVKAGMAPKSVNTVEKATVAIMHGLEVGLTPMAALQSIAVINGSPSIWGDGMLALIEASGLLDEMEEDIDYDDKGEPQSATCMMKRVGRKPTTRMFTRAMAARAGLLKKEGPWQGYPHRMMQRRARWWCATDTFSDVLKGLHSAEERQDMVDITDTGSATTAPPEPRRSDFVKAAEEDDTPTNVAPETWELLDEVGEMIGRFDAGDWGNKLVYMASKLTAQGQAQILENNQETSIAIINSDGTSVAVAEGIQAIFEPAAPAEPQPKNWKVQPSEPGEAAIIKGIMNLLDMDDADVPEIMQQNADRLQKMSMQKRGNIERHAEERLAALKGAGT